MTWLTALAASALLVAASPLVLWSERRVKAWTQLRQGPSPLLAYRDLRRLWAKRSFRPATASPYFLIAPILVFAVVAAGLFLLPLDDSAAGLPGALGLIVLGLILTLQRFLMATQAYDTATPFGGLGASRELFLGGLGEPAFFLVAAAVYLSHGPGTTPFQLLPVGAPSSWLIAAALALLWVAESARIPFDNPATHLELTMVHEAMLLEASGWVLALHELAAATKQTLLAALLVIVLIPLPDAGLPRVAFLLVAVIALSALLALVESAVAKLRLFRASHLLVMSALLAFLGGAVTYLEGGIT